MDRCLAKHRQHGGVKTKVDKLSLRSFSRMLAGRLLLRVALVYTISLGDLQTFKDFHKMKGRGA